MDSQLSLLKDKGRIWSKILFEDFLPKKEKKLILFKKTIEPQQLEDDDGLLEDFERQYLSPTTFETLVNSGSVLMISLCGDYKIKKNIRFGLGYDFYRKQREEIEKVYKVLSGSNIGSSVNINELNLGAAENLQAVQHKLLTELDFRVNVNKTKLHLGVGGDYTFSNKNIGRDWTLFGKLAFKF